MVHENHPFGLCSPSSFTSPSLCFLSSSKIPLTPSTSPTAALPPDQSTTIGHFSAFGFCVAILTIPSAEFGRASTVGCAERKVSPGNDECWMKVPWPSRKMTKTSELMFEAGSTSACQDARTASQVGSPLHRIPLWQLEVF